MARKNGVRRVSGKKKWILIGLGAVSGLVIVSGFSIYFWYQQMMTTPHMDGSGVVKVTIPPGTTFKKAAVILAKRGLIKSGGMARRFFILRAKQRDRYVRLKAGTYHFDKSLTPDGILDVLAKDPETPYRDPARVFSVKPGHNVFQVARELNRLGVTGDFVGLANDHSRLRSMGLPLPAGPRPGAITSLEGYVFPDSYHLDERRFDVKTAIGRAIRRFKSVFAELLIAHRSSYLHLKHEFGFTDHDLVTLASLVEKEVAVRSEAPLVAGVFYNRLRKGMKLQTDPTLVYSPLKWRSVPTPTHRRDKSNPYNTYHIARLPPGPISNPGRHALRAVLNPASTDALFFVARGGGRHAFAKTLREHRANIRKYRKGK